MQVTADHPMEDDSYGTAQDTQTKAQSKNDTTSASTSVNS